MESYDFEVLNGDDTIATVRLAMQGPKGLWPSIMELAQSCAPGCRIRVTDQSGEMIVFVGVTTARRALILQ